MAAHLRRFVTSPIPIFEFEFASESRAPPPLAAAAKSLALCIRVSVYLMLLVSLLTMMIVARARGRPYYVEHVLFTELHCRYQQRNIRKLEQLSDFEQPFIHRSWSSLCGKRREWFARTFGWWKATGWYQHDFGRDKARIGIQDGGGLQLFSYYLILLMFVF